MHTCYKYRICLLQVKPLWPLQDHLGLQKHSFCFSLKNGRHKIFTTQLCGFFSFHLIDCHYFTLSTYLMAGLQVASTSPVYEN